MKFHSEKRDNLRERNKVNFEIADLVAPNDVHLYSGQDIQKIRSALEWADGREIGDIIVSDSEVKIFFMCGRSLLITDEGGECCEQRYFHCDDDLKYHHGAEFHGIKLRSAQSREEPNLERRDNDIHSIQFLAVRTSRGEIVFSAHDRHTGGYGHFGIFVRIA